VKNAVILVLTGALLGIVAASFVVPPMLSWYASPGGLPKGAEVQALVEIPEVIRYTTSKLFWGQGIGAGLGALAGVVCSILIRPKRQAVAADRAPVA